jgi:hypothetical protein
MKKRGNEKKNELQLTIDAFFSHFAGRVNGYFTIRALCAFDGA